jgi:hypothetical protein
VEVLQFRRRPREARESDDSLMIRNIVVVLGEAG